MGALSLLFSCTPSDRPINKLVFLFRYPKRRYSIPLFVSWSYQLVWKSSIREEKKKTIRGTCAICGVGVPCFEEAKVDVAAYARTTRRLGSTNRKKSHKGTMMSVCAYSNLCRGTLTPMGTHKQADKWNDTVGRWCVYFFHLFAPLLVFLVHLLQRGGKKERPESLFLVSRQVFNRSFLRPHAPIHFDLISNPCKGGLSAQMSKMW